MIVDNAMGNVIDLVKASLSGRTPEIECDWTSLYDYITRNGLTAVTNSTAQQMPLSRELALKWALSSERIEARYRRQYQVALNLTKLYRQYAIETMIIKGIALARYYCHPEWREFGDIDIWLGDGYDEGNRIASDVLGQPVIDHPKHSKFDFEGVRIENHYIFSHSPAQNNALLGMLNKYGMVEDGELTLPAPPFELLFIIFHAANHFGHIGIPLRHVLDLGLFLKCEQSNIDWDEVRSIIRHTRLTRLSDAMFVVAGRLIGEEVGDLLFNPRRAEHYADIMLKSCETIQLKRSRMSFWGHIGDIISSYPRYSLLDGYWRMVFMKGRNFLLRTLLIKK